MTISGLVEGRVQAVGRAGVGRVTRNPDSSARVDSFAQTCSSSGIDTSRRLATAIIVAVATVLLLIGLAIAPTPSATNHPRPSAIAQTPPQAPGAG